MIRILRRLLGRIVLLGDRLTRPRPMRRTPEAQAAVDEATRDLALYQFRLCPFCIKVRRAIHRLNLHIELRDALNDPEHRAALLTGGGEIKVPCLAISADGETRWLYESSDIIDWLEHRFGETREARQAS